MASKSLVECALKIVGLNNGKLIGGVILFKGKCKYGEHTTCNLNDINMVCK